MENVGNNFNGVVGTGIVEWKIAAGREYVEWKVLGFKIDKDF